MAPITSNINLTNDPNYGNNSRSVDVPDFIKPRGVASNEIMPEGQKVGDRSAEYMGQSQAYASQAEGLKTKGFGDLFSSIVTIGDTALKFGVNMIQKDIENKVYEVADRERKAYTEALEQVKSTTKARSVLDSNASADEPGNTPDEVSNLPNSLESLSSARAAGKISNTYYYGRLLSEAKDLRAKYPGFREEIDAQFAKVTGVNPANAYVQSLIHDINTSSSQKNSEMNKGITYLQSRLGYPGAEKMMEKFKSGQTDLMSVYKWAAPYEQAEYNFKMKELIRKDFKGDKEQTVELAKDSAQTHAATVVRNTIDNVMINAGLTSVEAVQSLQDKVNSGAYAEQDFKRMGEQIAQQRMQLRTQMIRDFDAGGRNSMTISLGGKDEALKVIDANLKEYDLILDRIYNKDFGGAYSVANYIKSKVDTTQAKILDDSKVGPYFTTIQALKNIGGEQFQSGFFMDQIKGNIPERFKTFYTHLSSGMMTQVNKGKSGEVITFNDALDEVKKAKVIDKSVNKKVIGMIDLVTDPKASDAIKYNIASAAFDPKNLGMISRLNADGVDARGNTINGQFGVYSKFTSPEVTKEVKRLSEKDPQLWSNYVNWAKHTFSTELFSKEINSLSSVSTDPNVKLTWDTDNKRFKIENTPKLSSTPGYPTDPSVNDAKYRDVERSINKINSGLYGLKNIAKDDGTDPEAYILRTIMEGNGDLSNIGGVPGMIVDAIKTSRLKAKNANSNK